MGRWETSGACDCDSFILDKVGDFEKTKESAAKSRGTSAMHEEKKREGKI